LDIIHELSEGMKGCSTAFVAVAVAGIALSVAASSGMEMDDAPEVRALERGWFNTCRHACLNDSSNAHQQRALAWPRREMTSARELTLCRVRKGTGEAADAGLEAGGRSGSRC
jgi:hypothetical protein